MTPKVKHHIQRKIIVENNLTKKQDMITPKQRITVKINIKITVILTI